MSDGIGVGGWFKHPTGKWSVSKNGHSFGEAPTRVYEHILVAEKALGKPLPENAVVHHVNETNTDNRPGNLVICPDRAYHNLIHARLSAMNACGNPDWRKCSRCGAYDALENMRAYVKPNHPTYAPVYTHSACSREHMRRRGQRRKP